MMRACNQCATMTTTATTTRQQRGPHRGTSATTTTTTDHEYDNDNDNDDNDYHEYKHKHKHDNDHDDNTAMRRDVTTVLHHHHHHHPHTLNTPDTPTAFVPMPHTPAPSTLADLWGLLDPYFHSAGTTGNYALPAHVSLMFDSLLCILPESGSSEAGCWREKLLSMHPP
jgi:hypothetical protein